MLALFRNSVPAVLVIGPVKVFTPVRVKVPDPFLVRPPFGLPASSGVRDGDVVVGRIDDGATGQNIGLYAAGTSRSHREVRKLACRVPPLKLKTALVPVLVATLKVESVPPFRLLVPNEPAMRAMLMPPQRVDGAAALIQGSGAGPADTDAGIGGQRAATHIIDANARSRSASADGKGSDRGADFGDGAAGLVHHAAGRRTGGIGGANKEGVHRQRRRVLNIQRADGAIQVADD